MEANQKERDRSINTGGFTLIEAIAVLIILGILGVVIASRVSSTSTYSVKSQAEALKSHIRYAQAMAMGTGSVWGINLSSKQYSLFRDNVTTSTVILPGAESNPVVLEENGPSLSTGTIRFNGYGAPVDESGASITTIPAATVTVSMTGEPDEIITITRNTGFIP